MTSERTTVYLVRHGETRWNASRRLQGASDIELNDVGLAQAKEVPLVLESMNALPIDDVLSSTLSRAARTADIIAETIGSPVVGRVPGLIERSYGEAEGLTLEQATERWPEPGLFPGQESEKEVVSRTREALADIIARYSGKSLVVVTHGTVIRLLVADVWGVPGDEVDHVLNCSVTTLVADGEWAVTDFNRVSHTARN